MTKTDWEEFLTHHQYKTSLLANLQLFLHEKYINYEDTDSQQHYRELCNMAEYPGTYIPFRDDIPAKNYHLRIDQDIPHYPSTPKTFFMRKFGGSSFPVYKSDEEYDWDFFHSHMLAVDHPTNPSRFHTFTKHPLYPSYYALYKKDKNGQMVFFRNMPKEEDFEMNE